MSVETCKLVLLHAIMADRHRPACLMLRYLAQWLHIHGTKPELCAFNLRHRPSHKDSMVDTKCDSSIGNASTSPTGPCRALIVRVRDVSCSGSCGATYFPHHEVKQSA